MTSVPLNISNHPTHVVLDLGCTRSIASRAALTTEFRRCHKSFAFANSETETCWESCIIHFPTTPPCFTRVDVLETGDVPIFFSLSQMKNLSTTIELDPKGDNITCPAIGLYSSPAEHSTMGQSVWTQRSLPISPDRVSDLLTEETCNFCPIGTKFGISSSHTSTRRR